MKKYRCSGCNNKNSNGTVIFIVLVFILAVTTLVLVSTTGIRSEVEFIENETNRLRAYALCVSGREYLKNRLLISNRSAVELTDIMGKPHIPRLLLDGTPIDVSPYDYIQDKYRKTFKNLSPDNMIFYLELQDSAGLINAFALKPELLKNLLAHFGLPQKNAAVLMDSMYDWMDVDDFIRPNGAESDYYLKDHGYPAANRLIDPRDQLLLVRGFDKETYNLIGPLLDFSVENTGFNINTMPPDALYVFKGITPDRVETILSKRQRNPFAGPAEATLATGYNFNNYPDVLQFFTSNTTYVKIKTQMDEQRIYYLTYRLHQAIGAGSMRRGRQNTLIAPGRTPEEDFHHFFHVRDRKEGTERIEYE